MHTHNPVSLMPSLLRNIRIPLDRLIPIPTHSSHFKLIILCLFHSHSPLSPTPALGIALPFAPVAGNAETVGEGTVFAGAVANSAEE